MKDAIKKIIWLLIGIGIIIGIYMVLPEYPHAFVKSLIQPKVDSVAASRIDAVKNITDKDVDGLKYEAILTKKTQNGCWIYESAEDSDDGSEHVKFYARGASINIKPWTEYGGLMYTSTQIKMDFKIKNGKEIEIIPYVDSFDKPLKLEKHEDDNRKIRIDIFKQLANGMKSDG